MPIISGTVFDASGNPVAGRIVRAYRRDTGEPLAQTLTSDGITSPDPHWDKVVSLLYLNGNLDDVKGHAWTGVAPPQPGGPVLGAGRLTNPNGSSTIFLSVPDSSDWAFGTGDFTVELHVLLDNAPTSYYYCPMGNWSASTGWCFFAGTNGTVRFHSAAVPISSPDNVAEVGKWQHWAYAREAGVGRLFVDGALVQVLADTANLNTNRGPRLLGNRTTTDMWRGSIAMPRVTKGVARYTENFTPPTAPFPKTATPLPLGKYEIETAYTGECFVICFPNEDENMNAKIYDRIVPV